jgi:3-hydroxy-9,10-secoandrosta-1,3,5(10)-triene-9,17-dione monooxygenase
VVATCFSNLRAIGGTTLGYELHKNPFYRLPQLGFAACYGNAVVVGGSLAACDEFEHIARTKPPRVPGALDVPRYKYQAQVPDVQRNFALALADVEAAEGILRATSDDLAALGDRDYDMTDCLSIVLRMASAGKFAWKAVEDRLWRTIGSSQARDGARMERYWRDLSTYWNSPNNGYRELFAVGYAQGRWADLLTGP